jgi:phenylacetate-CoA ligase
MSYFDREMETIELEALKKLQNERLRTQIERCYRDIPYYKEVFDKHGLKPKHIRTTDDLVHAPTIEKKNLRELYPFGLLGVPKERIHRYAASSGTTGIPTVIAYTQNDWKVLLKDVLGRIFTSYGMDKDAFLYQSHGYGLFLGGVLMEHAMDSIGARVYPAGPGRTLAAIQWLADMKHTAISGTPTFMQHLINRAKENGLDPKVDWVVKFGAFGGETASPALRRKIVEGMPEGFAYNEQYGTSEVAAFCLHSCPNIRDEAEMHVIGDHFYLEVLDQRTGERVEPGEQGDLVFTHLTKEATPMIRWNTHDIARLLPEPYGCRCGRNAHAKVSRVLGRSDDVLKIRGTLVFPSQIEDILAGMSGTTEGWQIIVDGSMESMSKLKVEVEVSNEIWGNAEAMLNLENRFQEELEARFGTSGEIIIREPNSLPRYEGKAIRVVNQTEDDSDRSFQA